MIDGLGPYLSLKLIAECGDDLTSWPSAKHFTSWLGLAPSNKISGGKVLSSRTRRSGGRAAALLRLAAVTVGRTDIALGAFYSRLSSRVGKAKAVTATARKIAVLFYNAVRHGMEYVDPGASSYETRYRTRVVNNLHRRAKAFGFVLQPVEPKAGAAVSQESFSSVSSPILACSDFTSTAGTAAVTLPDPKTSEAPPSSCAFHAII
ncbi:hypothetical protein ACVWZV_009109 [Bradyrhizobium sp. GM5.1]